LFLTEEVNPAMETLEKSSRSVMFSIHRNFLSDLVPDIIIYIGLSLQAITQFMLHLVSLIIFIYLAVSACYLVILALAGKLATNFPLTLNPSKKRMVVLIPAYKEDGVIIETVRNAIGHAYPNSSFKIIVIADSLQKETLQKLQSLPVEVLEVNFENSTKAKSLHAALQYVKGDNYEIAVILDADNIMSQDCLEKINGAFHQQNRAIQCHRTAKNQDTAVARLDAISEQININLFRRGPAALKLSAMPLGSAMAFEFDLICDIFENAEILDNPAEDREIEIQLMMRQIKMEFLNDVFVYDEKVADANMFQKQRIRWLEAQLNHIRRFFKPDMKKAPRTGTFYHIFFQNFLLPRLFYLVIWAIITIIIILQWLFNVALLFPSTPYWVAWLLAYIFVLLVSIPRKYYSLATLRAMAHIPLLMISMLMALFKLKRNRTEFLHTPKSYKNEQ
jgi:cellulose synthase/poly-beta-1,6-N-acetylglucosamine synthase-like glycosyltransferase